MDDSKMPRIRRKEDLPDVMTMPLVAKTLGCSLTVAYRLLVPSCFGVQELMVTGVRTLFDIYTNKCSPLPEWMKAFAFMT